MVSLGLFDSFLSNHFYILLHSNISDNRLAVNTQSNKILIVALPF